MAEPVKLNLGAGEVELPGYIPLDIKQGQAAYPLPQYADGSVDEVRASHLLEHFGGREAPAVMDEWVRVLKPGGLLRIAVPDFEWVLREYDQGELSERNGLLHAYIMGGQVDEHDYHKSTWTAGGLRLLMESAGLTDIGPWESEVQDCAALPVSLNLQGRKRQAAAGTPKRVAVAAVMSVPRFMLSANVRCALSAFCPLHIPIMTHTGAFWHQTLTNVLEKAIEDGADIIFTLDYDAIFTPEDVLYMLRAMAEHPEFDALMGAMCKRDGDYGLMTQRDEDGKLRKTITLPELCQEFIPCASGHFGLTAFRADLIRTLTKPWLVAVPDKDGRWKHMSKLDPDMYFWKKWRDEGRSLHLAQKVRVGHVQDLVTWPRMDFQGIHQYLNEFRKTGMPEEARYQCPKSDS